MNFSKFIRTPTWNLMDKVRAIAAHPAADREEAQKQLATLATALVAIHEQNQDLLEFLKVLTKK